MPAKIVECFETKERFVDKQKPSQFLKAKQTSLVELQRDHWQKLHTTQFTPEEFEAWIQSIPGCSTCQRNLRRRLETLPPRYDDWNRFTWELHNSVNKEIGKPEFTWSEACKKYNWQDLTADIHPA
jgi:hypothetical protein